MSNRLVRFAIYALVGVGLFIWTQTRETDAQVADAPAVASVAEGTAETASLDDGAAAPDFGLEIDIAGEANGTITIDLFEDLAPLHVAQITAIAETGAYDGVVFHRVIEGFMAQTGDVQFGKGDNIARAGTGGSDLPDIAAEFSDRPFERGIVGMARSQNPNSANSQFFIMFTKYPSLDGQYTVVGEVTSGMDIVDQIKLGKGGNGAMIGAPDVMTAVRVTQ